MAEIGFLRDGKGPTVIIYDTLRAGKLPTQFS